MPQRDLYNNLATVQLLDPQAINDTDTKSALLDTREHGGALILVPCGTFTGADADSYVSLILQESDTTVDGDFTAVATTDMHRAITTATAGLFGLVNSTSVDNALFKVGYIGSKRYIRVLLDFTTGTGGVTAANVSVVAVMAQPPRLPAATVTAVAAT